MPPSEGPGSLPTLLVGGLRCLDEGRTLPTARLQLDGKISGLPKDHLGPMRFVTPKTLRFGQVAAAIRALQRLGGRLEIAVQNGPGKPVVVPVSLENDLFCFPLPDTGVCASSRRPPPVAAVGGTLSAAPDKTPSPPAETIIVRIDVLAESDQVRLKSTGQTKPQLLALSALDMALKALLERRKGSASFYVNAVQRASWPSVLTALAISHCRLLAVPEPGFDAVLVGSPSE